MTLNEFIDRGVAFFNKAEAGQSAELKAAQEKIATLEAQAKKDAETIAARDATIKELTAKLETAQNEVNAKGTEIANLKAAAEKAEHKADDVLASAGVDPKKIPAGKPDETPTAQGNDLLAKYNAITDPTERSKFYAQNRDKIRANFRPSKTN